VSARIAWALCGGAAVVIVVALLALPVSVPVADDSGVPYPGIGTAAPPVAPASDPGLQPVGALSGGQTVAQEFPANGTAVSRIGLYLGTDNRANRGTASVTLQAYRAGAWQDLRTESFASDTLRDGGYLFFTTAPAVAVQRGAPLRIVLRAEGGAVGAITWWKSPAWNPEGYALFLNGVRQDGTARFVVSYEPARGRLGQHLGRVWADLTVFLDPVWRIALIVGIASLILGLVLALRPLRAPRPPTNAVIVDQGEGEYTPADAEARIGRG
jgi:hypothetical protein